MNTTHRASATAVVLATIALFLTAPAPPAWSDCGSIPFFTLVLADPLDVIQSNVNDPTDKKVEFDPLKVTVFEPKQRAIIAWNGQEEILLLSTDQRASQKSAVLEVIPLPSEPTVRLGSFKTFENAQRLMVQKRLWACAHGGASADAAKLPEAAGRITFQQKLGAHDLSVAEARNSAGFVEFVQNYLQEKYKTPEAPIRPAFVKIIQTYLDEGYCWFALDVIELDGTTRSREPIEYRFKTDYVYYPLRISALEEGKTEVEHLVFAPRNLNLFSSPTGGKFTRQPSVEATGAEVEALDEAWKGFFGEGKTVTLNQWSIEGISAKLLNDVKAK